MDHSYMYVPFSMHRHSGSVYILVHKYKHINSSDLEMGPFASPEKTYLHVLLIIAQRQRNTGIIAPILDHESN